MEKYVPYEVLVLVIAILICLIFLGIWIIHIFVIKIKDASSIRSTQTENITVLRQIIDIKTDSIVSLENQIKLLREIITVQDKHLGDEGK